MLETECGDPGCAGDRSRLLFATYIPFPLTYTPRIPVPVYSHYISWSVMYIINDSTFPDLPHHCAHMVRSEVPSFLGLKVTS